MLYTFDKFKGTMRMKVLETIYAVIYLTVAVILGLILYPLSFLSKKDHYEESGYDL